MRKLKFGADGFILQVKYPVYGVVTEQYNPHYKLVNKCFSRNFVFTWSVPPQNFTVRRRRKEHWRSLISATAAGSSNPNPSDCFFMTSVRLQVSGFSFPPRIIYDRQKLSLLTDERVSSGSV